MKEVLEVENATGDAVGSSHDLVNSNVQEPVTLRVTWQSARVSLYAA
jgi:hypothetical protein